MAENVFILGAGASKESGAPLMREFLDVSEDLLRTNSFDEADKSKITQVFKLIAELQTVYAKSYLDLNNIEHLFGALELARIVNRLGDHTPEQISEFRDALVTLIVRTLEKKVSFPVVDKKRVRATESYLSLVEMMRQEKFGQSSIITFNYDLAMDFALNYFGISIDYGFETKARDATKLLKLHGSVNWGRCINCDEIVPYYLGAYFRKYQWFPIIESPTVILEISNRLQDLKEHHTHEDPSIPIEFDPLPVLIPPTWNKTEYHGSLSRVWSEAAKELSEARNIYVFGYSLPETDAFFKYLFALGTIGETRIRRFWVFNPDESDEIKARYRRLIGQGISDRFQYLGYEFSQGVAELGNAGR